MVLAPSSTQPLTSSVNLLLWNRAGSKPSPLPRVSGPPHPAPSTRPDLRCSGCFPAHLLKLWHPGFPRKAPLQPLSHCLMDHPELQRGFQNRLHLHYWLIFEKTGIWDRLQGGGARCLAGESGPSWPQELSV